MKGDNLYVVNREPQRVFFFIRRVYALRFEGHTVTCRPKSFLSNDMRTFFHQVIKRFSGYQCIDNPAIHCPCSTFQAIQRYRSIFFSLLIAMTRG